MIIVGVCEILCLLSVAWSSRRLYVTVERHAFTRVVVLGVVWLFRPTKKCVILFPWFFFFVLCVLLPGMIVLAVL